MRISLTLKILLPFVLFIFGYLLFAYSTIRETMAETNLAHAQNRATELLDSVVVAVESEVSERNFRRIVTALAVSEDIDSILIIDPQRQWVVASNELVFRRKPLQRIPQHIVEAANSLTPNKPSSFTVFGQNNYLFAGNLVTLDTGNNSIRPFTLVIMFNKGKLSKDFAEVEAHLIQNFSLAILLILVLGFVLVKKVISDPLALFKKSMQINARDYENRKVVVRSNDEFGELAEEYNRMLLVEEASLELARHTTEEAELIARKKSEFLATMSHEIRTPINGILGLTQLATKADSLPVIKEYLDKLMSSGRLLLEIINDILDFSKLLEGKITMDPQFFSPSECLSMVTEMMQPTASAKGIELRLSVDEKMPGIVKTDSHRLKQVLTNLVGNGIKFTEKGFVEVRGHWQAVNKHQGVFKIEVIDSGIGIEEQKLPDIFDAFSQEDSSTARRFGGTGLGLAICEQLTVAMHGKIYVDSVKGKGSTFTIELPCETASVKAYLEQEVDPVLIPRIEQLSPFEYDFQQVVDTINAFSQNDKTVLLVDGQQKHHLKQAESQALEKAVLVFNLQDTHGLTLSDHLSVLSSPLSLIQLINKLLFAEHLTTKTQKQKMNKEKKSPQILLVEDNDVNQLIIEEMLESLGAEVVCAGNGAIALKVLKRFDVDLVLMDVQMPELDGYQATSAIRNELKLDLPIIGISANVLPEDVQKGLKSGMNSYLNKPIMLKELEQELDKWL